MLTLIMGFDYEQALFQINRNQCIVGWLRHETGRDATETEHSHTRWPTNLPHGNSRDVQGEWFHIFSQMRQKNWLIDGNISYVLITFLGQFSSDEFTTSSVRWHSTTRWKIDNGLESTCIVNLWRKSVHNECGMLLRNAQFIFHWRFRTFMIIAKWQKASVL